MAIEYTPLESSNLVNNPSEGGNFSVGSPAEIADALSFASEAKKAQVAAELAETNAEGSASNAATSATNASTSATTASSAVTSAATSATNASNSATTASTAATNASNSETAAGTSETNAATSATTSTTKASEAATSATNASTSETNAATSATTATTKAGEASTSASNAATSATSAATAETNAETAETNAETAETNAAASATTATNQATAASTSETNAGTSATTATTKASEAATSATNASSSETAAATSATNASNSETAAGTSATNAASSATTATTKASEAVTSASNAATSATAAATAETNAETAETNAETAETNAATSATTATNQATAAGTSATNAAASATTATTKASEAATSATNAETAETAAVAAKDAALAAFDSFDDRYLGQKASDPAADNDGDSLAAGMLYFNTTSDVMKVYEGSNWVAAYASSTGSLLAANNLSDLASATSARTNLGLGTAATAASSDFAALSGATFTGEVEATAFSGDLTGAILFKGKAGESLTKGDPVYISGISGNTTIVSKADANDANKMPCFGIVDATVNNNTACSVVTFGTLAGLNTSTFTTGDELYISDTGTLTATAPSGETSQLQKIAKVTRSDSSAGSIKVMGAGRTNATPNLDDGKFFLGNSSNYAVTANFNTSVTSIALPLAGGALTGAVTTNSTFDGVDIAVRDAVLTATTNTANAALPKAGGTMTGPLIINETTAVKMSAGTTAQRPSGVAGQFRYNTTEGKFEGYSTEWGEIGGGAADLKLNSFTGNGSTTAYTLSSSPAEDNTLVYIDGVYQNKTSYAIVDNVLTFSAAPPSTSAIEITAATIAPVTASTEFKLSQFTGNGSTVAFTLSAQSPENNTNVYIDGVYQSKSNYSVSGTTLTFSTAPPNGSSVEVMAAHAVVVSVSTPDDGTITTAKIVNDAVTADKIADDAVGADAVASVPLAIGITSVVTATSLTATVNTHVYVSAAGQTITLPASPTIGQRVLVTVGNFVNTVIGRNGSNIMSSGTDMTLDSAYLSIQFIYTDATQGWVMS